MLHFTANDVPLAIRNVSIRLTLRSSIAGDNGGNYVYSTAIPNTEPNAAAFGFPYRLQRKDTRKSKKIGKIWWNNSVIQEGTWYAKTTGDETITLEMLIGGATFADSIAGKNLPELFDVPISVPDIAAHLNSQVTQTYPAVNHNFPVIYNPQFYGDPKETDPDKNPNLQFEGFLNNQVKAGFVANDKANKNAIVPQLYLPYIIKHIFENRGYTLQGTVMEDAMLKAAFIYNHFALDKLLATSFSGDGAGNTIAPDFFVIAVSNIQNPGNLYNAVTGEYTAMIAGDYQANISGTFIPTVSTVPAGYAFHLELWYNNILQNSKYITVKDATPLVLSMNTLLSIDAASAGGLITWKAYYSDANTNDGAFVNPTTLSVINTTQPNANILENNFNYKDMVPDMPVKDFLKMFYSDFGIRPFFNETAKTVTLLFWNELLNTKRKSNILNAGLHRHTLKITANDYEGLTARFDFSGSDNLLKETKNQPSLGTVIPFSFPTSIQGDVYYCESLNAYFRRDYNRDTKQFEWIAIGDQHPDYIVDEGKEPITIRLAPMLMRNPTNNAYVTRNLPAISTQGTSDAFQLRNECPLRIMFWVGIVARGTDGDYPLASTTRYGNASNVVLPMSWKADEIIARYFPEWLAWRKRREGVTFTNELTAADMAALDFRAAYYFQSAQILLEEAYTKLQNRQLGPAKLKGWTV